MNYLQVLVAHVVELNVVVLSDTHALPLAVQKLWVRSLQHCLLYNVSVRRIKIIQNFSDFGCILVVSVR